MLKRLLKASAYLVSATGVCLFLLARSCSQPSVDAQPFARDVWIADAGPWSTNDPGCVRGSMALDLIESERLVGLRHVQVEELLGRPRTDRGTWVYELGQCSGWGWHHSYLTVHFGAGGLVAAAKFKDYAP